MAKKLKSLDEPLSKQIANTKKINKVLKNKYKKTERYKHNQQVLKNLNTKPKKTTSFAKTIKTILLCTLIITVFIVYTKFFT